MRQGALNSVRVFLPMMPPKMVRGMVMSAQMRVMITMVPKGSAAVDCSTAMQQHFSIHCSTCTLHEALSPLTRMYAGDTARH